jgi:ADP-heptose:LPS heptosyltransferase
VIGVPELPAVSGPAQDDAVAAVLREIGIGLEPLVVIHPGSGSPLKAWPLDRFAEVGTAVAARLGARLVVTGSPSEWPLARQLCAALPDGSTNLAGRLDWCMLEALLRRATLVIGVDSGPLHLAVAARTPSVALFGPADPVQFGPWGPQAAHRVVVANLPCRPCRRLDMCRLEPGCQGPPPCMRAIDAAAVTSVALAVVSGPHG